jgi:hypothetical protein
MEPRTLAPPASDHGAGDQAADPQAGRNAPDEASLAIPRRGKLVGDQFDNREDGWRLAPGSGR